MRKSLLAILLSISFLAATSIAATVYQDDFSGPAGTDLNGLAPDVAPAGVVWAAGNDFNADGTVTWDSDTLGDTIYLPIDGVEQGHVCELSAKLNSTSSGGTNNDWLGIGFTEIEPNPEQRWFDDGTLTNPLYWGMSRRDDSASFDETFTGPGRLENPLAVGTISADKIRIVIDATTDTWTAKWYFTDPDYNGGVESLERTVDVPAANQGLFNYVAITSNRINGSIDDFLYTDIPMGAWNPDPNGEIYVPITTTTFSWNMGRNASDVPNPNITGHYLYFVVESEATDDPNLDSVAPITITDVTDPIEAAIPVTLDVDMFCYWRVDESINNSLPGAPETIKGPVWSFETVKGAPIILQQPAGVLAFPASVVSTETADFEVQFSSTSAPTAQWYKYVDGVSDTLLADGGDNTITLTDEGSNIFVAALSIANIEIGDEGYYYCKLKNSVETVGLDSDNAGLTVKRLLAQYEFEGDLTDSEGSNDGTMRVCSDPNDDVFGTPVYTTGIVGSQAIDLNGSECVELSTDAYPKTGVGAGMDSGTVSCWVNVGALTGFGSIMSTVNDDITTFFQFFIDQNSTVYARLRNNVGASSVNVIGTPVNIVDDGQWHLLTMTYQTNGPLRVYMDGAQIGGDVTVTSGVYDSWQYPLLIGANDDRGIYNDPFIGYLDDLKVYNYPLTEFEVADLYVAVYPDASFCLIEYASDYDFDDNCIVDLADFVKIAMDWLSCGLYPTSACSD